MAFGIVRLLHKMEPSKICDYSSGASGISDFADYVGDRVIVIHPVEPAALPHNECLDLLAKNIRALQQTEQAVISVETFRGRKWIGYEDIFAVGLPVCMDTSHLVHNEAMGLLDRHLDQIRHVHLSEVVDGCVHQPVGEFGIQVVDKLVGYGWTGSICLEHMDEHAGQVTGSRGLQEIHEDVWRIRCKAGMSLVAGAPQSP
jgi:sugar phosphate isomerase/epimerase